MVGLISTAMNGTEEKDLLEPGKTLQANAVGVDPALRGVEANETVSGQLDKLMAADSPVLQRARAGAAGVANSRGLLNSSMGVQAGEAAVLDAALPIASADAGVQNLAARENQAATNTALQVGADSTNKASLVNADAASQYALQGLRGEQATNLANIEANYKSLIQTNQSAAVAFDSATKAIAAIMADTYTSQAQKQAAVDTITQLLQSNLNVAGAIGNVDLVSLLDFTAQA